MRAIGTVFSTVVFLFFLTLIGRLVFDWVACESTLRSSSSW